MTQELRLRERKKLRTRHALITAGLRLFHEKGFGETTVAEIAAAADIATRTFFSYFACKEDVVFFDNEARVERGLDVIVARGPGETIAELLSRAIEEAVFSATATERAIELAPVRSNLVASVPELQARELHLMLDTQRRLVRALQQAYPEELDPVDASAAVGALVGAAKLTSVTCIDRGDSPEQVLAAIHRAADVVVRGLESLGT